MSCQLMLIATFKDVESTKDYLFPHLKDQFKNDDAVGDWDDADWGWKDSDDGGLSPEDSPKETGCSWLQECQVSVSPTGELIGIANEAKLVLLAQKWDTAEEGEVAHKYMKVFEDNIAQEDGEKISSILCLPLASQKRSTHGGPDWTCVIVGFTSGWVRIYTESGTLMLSQIFSEEPVVRIKCRTYELPRYVADAEKHEEIAILYRRALVTIDGFSFFQSLRACRNQVARAAASGSDQIPPPPLAYKKWALQEQDTITDHITCGLVTPNTFDQMQTASVLGGYGAAIKPTPPASHQYVTAGIAPYIGFFYAIEGSAQPMLSDVAHAVASKLKSALFSQISAASGWLGLGSRQGADARQDKKRPKIEPATALPNRFGLPDKRRHGERIHLSPDNKLAAVTDSFGRVMLIDIHRGVALRMWKGYRDAQVGWIEVKEDTATDPNIPQRHALFLIIYAPRRGILEVWTSQQGPRVAAFNVSKWCCLLCPGYSLMGLNNVTCRDVKVPIFSCYLLHPSGTVRTIEVPFHLALSDKNSKRARDLHLLKKLKVALRETPDTSETLQTTVIDMLLDIRIASIRQQGLEKVLHTKHLPAAFLQATLAAVNQQLATQAREAEETEGGSLDYESRMLEQFCVAEEKLLSTYIALTKLNEEGALLAPVPNTDEEMAKCLGLKPCEVTSLQSQMATYHSVVTATPRVTFAADSTMSPIDFISCFTCHLQHREKTEAGAEGGSGISEKPSIELFVQLKQGLTDARRLKLGNFLFYKVLKEGSCADFDKVIEQSSVSADNLLTLLVTLWLAEDPTSLQPAVHLHALLAHITQRKVVVLADPAEVTVSPTSLSPWWQELRTLCTQSENVVAALVAAMVGKTVATEAMGKVADRDSVLSASTDSSDMSSWESVSLDRTQWTVLVKQLEDLLALQCLLKLRPSNRFAAAMVTGEQEPITVSVKKVLDGGRGVLPEVVAKWIASQAIPPSMLCLTDPVEKETQQGAKSGEEKDEAEAEQKPASPIVDQLQSIQRRLPHSLDSDILMANCAWEYVLIWNRDPEVVFLLQQAIAYLRCIQNAAIQHGVAAMMWQMFVVKKVSAAAFLIDKVGKSPKERLCRRDVGISDCSLEKFLGVTVDLLDTLIQASQEPRVVPVLNVEDLWGSISGPTSLVELALEQKDSTVELVEHHYNLTAILHAVMAFSMRSVKPFSLFDTKGKNAFFKPIHSNPVLPSRVVDDSIIKSRQQFLCKVITNAVLVLTDTPLPISASTSASSTPATTPSLEKHPVSLEEKLANKVTSPTSPQHRAKSPAGGGPATPSSPTPSTMTGFFTRANSMYSRWPQLVLKLGRELNVDLDILRRHHVCELYSSGLDKLAEEVLLTVSDHAEAGSQLVHIVGQRLAESIFTGDPAASVDKLSNCPPAVSNWLKTVDRTQLRCPTVPLKDTAALIGQVVNQLPEGHSEYNMAISLVELVHSLM